jgi:hypothetical protein
MPVSTIQNASLASGVPSAAKLPAGSVLQVVQTTKTDTFSTTSSTPSTVMSASITPLSANSKILLLGTVNFSGQSATPCLYLTRNGTIVIQGDGSGSRTRVFTGSHLTSAPAGNVTWLYAQIPVSMTYLDSPSTTSAITYAVQLAELNGTTSYINRTVDDVNATWITRSASTLVLMEIAG